MIDNNWVITIGCSATYLFYVAINRYRYVRYLDDDAVTVQTLDSAHAIVEKFQQHEFPLLIRKSLEFGLFRTYGIPSISTILAGTKELTDRCARRYDDTDLLISEFTEQHPHSWRAETAIRRLNFIHGNYKSITNADYLYVLAVFMIEPIRWVDKYGYRKSHWKESRALFMKFRDIGMKMGIENVFESEADARQYYDEYEQRYMVPHRANSIVAASTMELFLSTLPAGIHPLGRSIVYALCDQRLRTAMAFPDPSLWAICLSRASLLAAAWITRYLLLPRRYPCRRTPLTCSAASSSATTCSTTGASNEHTYRPDKCPHAVSPDSSVGVPTRQCPDKALFIPRFHIYEKTYPEGYRIEELGPTQWVQGKELGGIGKSDMK